LGKDPKDKHMPLFLQYAWLIPLLPLVASALITLTPLRRNGQASGWLATLLLALATVIAVGVVAQVAGGAAAKEATSATEEAFVFPVPDAVQRIPWAATGQSVFEMGFYLDRAAAVMLAMVTLTGTMIHLFSLGYMAHDARQGRFFSFTALFTAAMLLMCLADNLLLFFMAWEVMGLCSYLLIGFFYERPTAYRAAVKAFITTRIGDVLLLLGLVYLYTQTGSLQFGSEEGQLFNRATLEQLAATPGFFGLSAAGGIALLIFGGTVGKSAQFPLHVWLPDAMEGPTPVSALIHAATMVAAGVFLVARTFPLFEVSGVLPFVAFIGALTALLGALMAVAQFDIKRILAYSTMSQLGFMIAALGIGAWTPALFHLLTHAFFKALLFLGSGSVIHGMEQVTSIQRIHHTDGYRAQQTAQDIRNMGGLRRYLPWTFGTYLMGYLALAGIPIWAGFWSKDEILADALNHDHFVVFGVLLVASFLTAFYMTRQMALVFFGPFRGNQPRVAEASSLAAAVGQDAHGDEGEYAHHDHAHDTSHAGEGYDGTERAWHEDWRMTMPLVVLATFALAGGFFNLPTGLPAAHWLADLLQAPYGVFNVVAAGLAVVVALAGVGLGVALYRDAFVSATDSDPLERLLGQSGWRVLHQRFFIDELYRASIGRLSNGLAAGWQWVDRRAIAPVVNGVGALTLLLSRANARIDDAVLNDGVDALANGTVASGDQARRSLTGLVQDYIWLVCAGLLLLAVIYLYGV
jgi:NADH-quinone oxidoreductase subunit L